MTHAWQMLREGMDPERRARVDARVQEELTTMPSTSASPERMLRWFVSDHLPEALAEVSMPFSGLAHEMCERLHPGPERTVMLRKLLEAKDAAVRQKIEDQSAG